MEPIRERLADWAQLPGTANQLSITILDYVFPDCLSDRAVEVCEPLYKIAIAAGEEWFNHVRQATAAVFGVEEDESRQTLQLAAIRDAFRDDLRLSTSELVDRLVEIEDSPFPNWWFKDSDPKARGRSLAKILKPFGIKVCQMRIAGVKVKGYLRAHLEPIWERYCDSSATQKAAESLVPKDPITLGNSTDGTYGGTVDMSCEIDGTNDRPF